LTITKYLLEKDETKDAKSPQKELLGQDMKSDVKDDKKDKWVKIDPYSYQMLEYGKKMEFVFEVPPHVILVGGMEPIVDNLSTMDFKEIVPKLEELGLGGMDDAVKKIVTNVLRLKSGKLSTELAKICKPPRGMVLFGPPGTGKTTFARNIAKLLGVPSDRLQMITGTDVTSKWLGESEKNIRELFEPAEKSFRLLGDLAPLFMIVIDEIDAMLPSRARNIGSNRDPQVNQFLGKLDGLEALNNILVIGITNRLELVDKAALRFGRLGCHIHIPLPNHDQRQNIWRVYLKKLFNAKILKGSDHELERQLAHLTGGLSGCDIEQIISKCIGIVAEQQEDGNQGAIVDLRMLQDMIQDIIAQRSENIVSVLPDQDNV